jgi:hypothetical protein
MKITLYALCFFVVFSRPSAAQSLPGNTPSSSGWCGTGLPPNYSKLRKSAMPLNLVSTLKHDTCLNKKFSIVFYVVAEPSGSWGLSQANLDTAVARLNRAFAPICVSFMNCSTAVIPNHVYNDWIRPDTEKYIVPNWHTDKTISIYLPSSISGSVAGYAYYPGGKDVIVIEKLMLTGLTTLHEMGHFMGLPHTHDESFGPTSPGPPGGVTSYEFVSRTNCYQHGDGFCDTEADCYPLPNGTQDGNSEFYIRPIDNIMSYHLSTACRFTQEQYNFMARVIATQRLYLH